MTPGIAEVLGSGESSPDAAAGKRRRQSNADDLDSHAARLPAESIGARPTRIAFASLKPSSWVGPKAEPPAIWQIPDKTETCGGG